MNARLPIFLLAAFFLAACPSEGYEVPTGEGNWVLVDLYHTRLQNPEDHRLTKGNYSYQGVHGYSRLFDHLKDHGYPWASIREKTLSAPRLEGYKVLFINLLHEARPDFTPEEVKAIQEYVKAGGGLVIMADHTNVYRHAERINPVLAPMGLEVTYHSSLDYAPNAVSGIGWIAITNLEPHPTNDGIEMISFQTGGTMTEAGATARTSAAGFADFWDESNTGGFYGNWRFDGDDANEPRGDVPVVVAAEYGKGRVAVVGDQNVYGDAWVHFGDNFKHALNIFEWAAGVDDAATPLRDTRPQGFNVGVDVTFNDYAPGTSGNDAYYSFFVHLNRDQDVTARGLYRLDQQNDALVLPSPTNELQPQDLDAVRQYLRDGKDVVVLTDAGLLAPRSQGEASNLRATISLIKALAPDFSLVDSAGATITFDAEVEGIEEALSAATFTRDPRTTAMVSDLFDAAGLEVARYTEVGGNADKRFDPDHLQVTSTWGDAMLRTASGQDVARVKKVDAGRLIIFLQDGFWRNRTLGSSEAAPPPAVGEPAVELLYRFLDHLKTKATP